MIAPKKFLILHEKQFEKRGKKDPKRNPNVQCSFPRAEVSAKLGGLIPAIQSKRGTREEIFQTSHTTPDGLDTHFGRNSERNCMSEALH